MRAEEKVMTTLNPLDNICHIINGAHMFKDILIYLSSVYTDQSSLQGSSGTSLAFHTTMISKKSLPPAQMLELSPLT